MRRYPPLCCRLFPPHFCSCAALFRFHCCFGRMCVPHPHLRSACPWCVFPCTRLCPLCCFSSTAAYPFSPSLLSVASLSLLAALDVPGFEPGYDSVHEPMNNTSPLFLALAALIFAAKWAYGCGNLSVAQVP